MPTAYMELKDGIWKMFTIHNVKREPKVEPRAWWHCPGCKKAGGSLGFAMEVGLLKTRFCCACDSCTKQVSVQA